MLAAPLQALAQQVPTPKPIAPKPPTLHSAPLAHLTNYAHRPRVSPAAFPRTNLSPTLLDEVGRFARNVSPFEAEGWKRQLRQGHLSRTRAARLHLWVGEWEMAKDEQPEPALAHFDAVLRLLPPRHTDRGLAAYDRAIALYFEGAYAPAADAFRHLLASRTLRGYDRARAALWLRHAAACAGYHEDRSKQGIPEPPRLDPLCGVAALAACLKAQLLPSSKAHLLASCRVTGRGSTLQDLLDAGPKLGVSMFGVTADDAGLQSMPLPAIAYVERDHFICVTKADRGGVTYLCSDCGAWPGGAVHLSWKQWHSLEATAYALVTRKGSPTDRLLSQALHPDPKTTDPNSSNPKSSGALLAYGPRLAAYLARHLVALRGGGGSGFVCGFPNFSLQCLLHIQCCPDDCAGPNGDLFGSLGGDPVNLATGEETYTPPADLSVYNPKGPSVHWGRIYETLRGYDPFYEYDDLGYGWSHPYNVGVYDPQAGANPQIPVGTTLSLTPNGTDPPNGNWEITLNGNFVANNNTPGAWNVTYSSSKLNITVPANANPVTGYEARYNNAGSSLSVTFDVLPTATVAEAMGPFPVPVNGTDPPASNTTLWDIKFNGAVVATSTAPNGWTVTLSGSSTFSVSAPSTAVTGSGYEVRYKASVQQPGSVRGVQPNSGGGGGNTLGPYSGTFTVIAPRVYPLSGTKYVVEENGARIAFTAPSIPSAANPTVLCSVMAGAPMQVSWNYSTITPFGTYTVLFSNRSQWITTPPSQFIYAPNFTQSQTISVAYSLSQQVDRNGNSIQLVYGAAGPSGFPLLSSITDSSGSALLTFTRATDGTGNLVSVHDRYGRYVYYQEASEATEGVPPPWPQAFQELTHVSQVQNGPANNAPDRYAYTYLQVANSAGEGIPMLRTLSVPSPTGTGQSTATLTLANSTGYASSMVDGNGNKHTYTFVDNSHCQVKIYNSAGTLIYSHTAGFDATMNHTSDTNGAVNGQGQNTTIIYSATFGGTDPYRPTEVLDGNGYAAGGANHLGEWLYTWDTYGHCLTATSPYNITTTYTWNYTVFPMGELLQVQEGTKSPTTISYFEPSGLTKQVNVPQPGTVGSNQTVAYSATYSTLGNLLTITGPGNNAAQTITTTYNYTQDGSYNQAEALGEPILVTDNLGNSSHLRYNPLGEVSSATDALGNQTSALYYFTGQLEQVILPATGQSGAQSGYTTYSYQYPGGPVSLVTVNDEGNFGLIRQYTPQYGAEGELLGMTGNLNPYSVTYDGAYRPLTLTDGNGNPTQYAYATAGYLQTLTYPNLDTVQALTWDEDGNVLTATNGRGVQYTYQYNDPESRLTSEQSADGTINNNWQYDTYGRLQSSGDLTGGRSFTYDDDDLTLTHEVSFANLPLGHNSVTQTYAYYPDSSEETLTLSCLAVPFTYTYNGRGDLTGLSNPYGETTSWSYYANDWMQTQTLSSGTTTTYTLNAIGELTDLSNKQGGTVLSDYNSSGAGHYDGAGNLLGLTASLPTAPTSYSGTSAYQYDTHDQIKNEQSSRLGSYTNAFSYDAAGNPTTFRGVDPTGGKGYTPDNQNAAYTFDKDGNPTIWQGNALTFDAGNHLTKMVNGAVTVLTAGYNAEGLRAWKQSAAGSTYYVYDGLTPVVELDGNGNVTAVNTWGAAGLAGRHTTAGSGSSTFYTFDVQGSVSQRLSGTGTVLGTYGFDSYGNRVGTDNSADPYSGFGAQFGYLRDGETGLSLCGERYYDPGQGRFLNRDPIGYGGGLNVYAYCGSNPMGGIDPQGTDTHEGHEEHRGRVTNNSSSPVPIVFDIDDPCTGQRVVIMTHVPPGYTTDNGPNGIDVDFVPGWGNQWAHIPGWTNRHYDDGPFGTQIGSGPALPFRGSMDNPPPDEGGWPNGKDPFRYVPPEEAKQRGWIKPTPPPMVPVPWFRGHMSLP